MNLFRNAANGKKNTRALATEARYPISRVDTDVSLGPICQGLSPASDSELIALVIARRQRAWPKTNLVDIPCIH